MLRLILIIAAVIAAILLMSWMNSKAHQRRLLAIAASRRGVDSWSNFLADFPEWPDNLLFTLYKNIIDLSGVKDFPLLPDDDLFDMLELDQDDLDAMLETELAKAGIDTTSFQGKMPDQPVQTVRDMLNWISNSIHLEDTSHAPR